MSRTSPGDDEQCLDLSRLQYYKNYFGKLLSAVIFSIALNFVTGGAFVWVQTRDVEREYYGQDSVTARLTEMVPLSEPFVSPERLLDWTDECVGGANNYDFVHWHEQLQRNSQCFTPHGRSMYMEALDRCGNLDLVKKERLVTSALPLPAPVVTNEGMRRGVWTWQIEVPYIVSYQGGQGGRSVATQKSLVTQLVSRVNPIESRDGLGIAQYLGGDLR
ncbi:DotI/IcmL family type IV secretion protein [Pseudomonas aeruginosa]|uniref:DotI/IcmL family type IV secretion protein n=1 Tax=Pseudomonas aeruginosa TaxID=287 RepID=UPI001E4097FA|nr:DotI/IcmL family type IV secretion protein [Pseudomonas aeruginosa]MCC9290259.1 DotI/IcmL family type IV secretion protein [Pseudomonas aeruginosa]UVN19072.1 putative IcmL-like type IV secretion system protein [Pseudomonas aeruginosa]